MKLTDQKIIQTGEQKLFDLIRENLNRKTVKDAVNAQCSIRDLKDIQIGSIDMVILDNQIAYQVNLLMGTLVALFISRSGNLLKIDVSEELISTGGELLKSTPENIDDKSAIEGASVLASELSAMIVRINQNEPVNPSKTGN